MRYFSPQVCFADARDEASGLFIVAKGWIELCLPVKHGGHALRLLKRGCVQMLALQLCLICRIDSIFSRVLQLLHVVHWFRDDHSVGEISTVGLSTVRMIMRHHCGMKHGADV
jgi:hypothetical protein